MNEISEIHSLPTSRFSTTSWPQRRQRRRWGGGRRRSSGPASIVTPSWSSPSTTGLTTSTGSRFSKWFQTRRLFFLCLLVVEAFGISAVILTVHWAINIKVSWNILSNHCTVVTIVIGLADSTISRVEWVMLRTWASRSTGTPSSWPCPSSFSTAMVSFDMIALCRPTINLAQVPWSTGSSLPGTTPTSWSWNSPTLASW